MKLIKKEFESYINITYLILKEHVIQKTITRQKIKEDRRRAERNFIRNLAWKKGILLRLAMD
jgi:hypothetical protein